MSGETFDKWRKENTEKVRKERLRKEAQTEREQRPLKLAREQSNTRVTRSMLLCTQDTIPCLYCQDTPTAHVLVTPAEYGKDGHVKNHAIYLDACFTHCRSLRLLPGLTDTKAVVQGRKDYVASVRADRRSEYKAAQVSLFDDMPQNPLLKDT